MASPKEPKIVSRVTKKLTPYANNARTHEPDQIEKIAASITEFGFLNPVIIDGKGEIIAGHGRVLAAELLELKTVPCIIVKHLTDDQKKAYVIADNRLGELSEWDKTMLLDEISGLSDSDFELDLMGVDVEFISGLTPDAEFEPELDPGQASGDISEDDVQKTGTKLGEAYSSTQVLVEVICPHCAGVFNIDPDAIKANA